MCVTIEWVVDHWGGVHLEYQWKVCPLTILVDSMPIRGMIFQLSLFARCSPHPSWQCPWFPHGFPHPEQCEGPEEHPTENAQRHFQRLLAWLL